MSAYMDDPCIHGSIWWECKTCMQHISEELQLEWEREEMARGVNFTRNYCCFLIDQDLADEIEAADKPTYPICEVENVDFET